MASHSYVEGMVTLPPRHEWKVWAVVLTLGLLPTIIMVFMSF